MPAATERASQRSLAPPAAVLWDMDGTLIDSEPYWIAAEIELVEAHGGSWTHDDGIQLVGNELTYSAAVLQQRGVDLGIPEIIDFLTERVVAEARREMPWQVGAQEILQSLVDADVPTALVTMSYRAFAALVAESAPAGALTVVVSGDEVTRGKPDPEPYLIAARMLGVDIRDCVAVEDSPSGLRSALASGARTIGVPCVVPIPAEPGLSRLPSLVGLTLDDLAAVRSGVVIDRIGDEVASGPPG